MPSTQENSDDREIDESGRYVSTVTPDRVLSITREVIEATACPVVTTRDVAEEMDVSRESVRKQFMTLVGDGHVGRRKVGGRAVVWWPINDATSQSTNEEADT